jgi:hypothetical protein
MSTKATSSATVQPVQAAAPIAQAILVQSSIVNRDLVAKLQQEVLRLRTPSISVPNPALASLDDKARKAAIKAGVSESILVAPFVNMPTDPDYVERFASVALAITHGYTSKPSTGRNDPVQVYVCEFTGGNGISCHYRNCDCYGILYSNWTPRRNALSSTPRTNADGTLLLDADGRPSFYGEGLLTSKKGSGIMGLTQLGVDVWFGRVSHVYKGTPPTSNTGRQQQANGSTMPVAPDGSVRAI